MGIKRFLQASAPRGPLTAGLAALLLATATACPPPPKPRAGGTVVTVDGDGEIPAPGNFTPGPPLEDPLPPDPGMFGLAYLQRVHPPLRDAWGGFLEDARVRLPPDHPLNAPGLEVRLELVLDRHGAVVEIDRVAPSGNAEFDQAAEEIARDAGPFPPAPRELVSDDDRVYLSWLFARDRRQAGVATAEVKRIEYPLDRAVPKLAEEGAIPEAARRLHDAARAGGDPAQVQALTLRVAVATLRDGLRAEDPAVQRLAVDAVIAAAAGEALAPASRELQSIAGGSVELPLRAAAIDALAAIGDRAAAPLLLEVLDKDGAGNPALAGAAVRALVALGEGGAAADRLGAWLGSRDRAKVGGALATLAVATAPKLTPAIAKHAASKEVALRIAACGALGEAAGRGRDASAWKPLRAGLDDRDASVRAACARAVATAAAAGASNRTTYWKLTEVVRDRDERVRAGAVLAALRLEPAKFVTELTRLAREKSPAVLAALATGLGGVPGKQPHRRLVELAGHADVGVRAAAIAALAARSDATARGIAAGAVVDPELAVRLAAIPAIDDTAALDGLAGDPSPELAAAARARKIAVLGRAGSLVEVTGALAGAPPTAERVRIAAAWLQAR